MRLPFSYNAAANQISLREGHCPGDAGRQGASAVPAGKASSALLPGGPGIMPAGITTGVRGASLELGGETFPRSLAGIAPRDYTPLGKNRGGTPAGERARKRRAAQAALSVARPARRLRAGTDDSATAGVPLSFYFIAGSEPQRTAPQHFGMARSGLDGLEFCHRSPSSQAGGGKQIGCLTSPASNSRANPHVRTGAAFSLSPCGRGWRVASIASDEPGEGCGQAALRLTRPRSASPPLGHPPRKGRGKGECVAV
jgi:hypothetical protein